MKYLIVVAAMLSVIMISCARAPQVKTVITVNKQTEWMKRHFNQGTDKITLIEGGISVRGNCNVYLFGCKDHKLLIGVPYGIADDHSNTRYMVRKMSGETITVFYETEFNHTSFGKYLIEKDSGTFEVVVK